MNSWLATSAGPTVPERVRDTLRQRGERTVAAKVKMCLDATGNVSSLDIVESSDHRVYDGQILVSMRTWQFRGHAMPNGAKRLCTHVPVVHQVEPNG